MKWKTHFLKQTNMVFKKINTIFFKKTSFLYIFCLLPWKFVESLLQTFSQTFRGGCKFDWNFQCKLAGLDWKFQCKLSRLDWNFKETCRATLKVSCKRRMVPNIGWLSCNGFGLQCSNPKPNYNPTPNEYTYIYIYISTSVFGYIMSWSCTNKILGQEQLN